MFQTISNYFATAGLFDFIEIAGLASGIIYILLQFNQHRLMWYFNLVSTASICAVSIHTHIWASAGLNAYLFIMSCVGIIQWRRLRKDNTASREQGMHIAKITSKVLAQSALIAVLAGTAMFFILKNLTNDPAPALDATAMTLSIIAAWWLAKAYIYQFFLWIVANSFSIILFGSQGKWFAVALYCVYIVVSFFGYFNWKKKAVVHG